MTNTYQNTSLDYNNGKNILPENAFRISASQFNLFMTKPHQWFREQVLGEKSFTGNTASVLGTIIHYIAECVSLEKEVRKDHIEMYISSFENNEEVDTSEIRSQYKQMAETLVNGYILKNQSNFSDAEPFEYIEILPGIFPSGSIDRVEKVGDGTLRIVDYKTYNSKTKPKSIPMNYKYQLLIYAYLYGNVSEIRLVYINRFIEGGISDKTGKPLKSYPPEVTVLTEQVTKEDIDFIVSVLKLCAETYQTYLDKPEMAYLLYRDYRLKKEN